MAEKRPRTKAELKRLFTGLKGKSITDSMISILIDVLWREKPNSRRNGFYWAGGPDSEMSFTDATRTFMLAPRTEEGEDYVFSFRFFSWADKPVLHERLAYDETEALPNPDAVQLPDEEGLYIIYYDLNITTRRQELMYLKNPTLEDVGTVYLDKVVAGWVYWDAVNKKGLYVGDSRHGSEISPAIRWMWQSTMNSQRHEGLVLTDVVYEGDGSADTDYQFGISAGKLWHEDIFAELEAVLPTGGLPVWYFANGIPRYGVQAGKKFLSAGSGRIAYNATAGLAEAEEGHYVVYHLFATNCQLQPIIAAMGRGSYASQAAAAASIATELTLLRDELPHSNLMHIQSVILQTSDEYGNGAKGRVVYTGGDGVGVTTIFTEEDPDFPIDYLKYVIGGQTKTVTDIPKRNGVEAGGYVSWSGGLSFIVTPVAGRIMRELYKILTYRMVTLTDADPTHPRIDLIILDTTPEIRVLTGVPAENPQKPTVDPATQLELTHVLVPAAATEPAGVTGDMIFDEGTGEWVRTTQGVAVNFNYGTNPFSGLICADAGAIGNGDTIVFTASEPLNIVDYETFIASIKLKEAMTKQHILYVEFMLLGAVVSSPVTLLGASTSLDWQVLALQFANITFSAAQFDAVRFRWSKSGALTDHAGFYFDRVKIEKGVTQPEVVIDDTYVSNTFFDEQTGDLTLFRNNKPALVQNLDGRYPTEPTVVQVVNNYIQINNEEQVPGIIQNSIENFKQSALIEHSVNVSETLHSSWGVIAYNELVGEFKAVVMVRDKVGHGIVSLMNILSFDYTDSTNEVSKDNKMLTDGTITLTLGIHPTSKLLYATVGNMPESAKRIHFCFERCILSTRIKELEVSGVVALNFSALLSIYREMATTGIFALDFSAMPSMYKEMKTSIGFDVNLNAELIGVSDSTPVYLDAEITMTLGLTAKLNDAEPAVSAFIKPEFEVTLDFTPAEVWYGGVHSYGSNIVEDNDYIYLALNDSYIKDYYYHVIFRINKVTGVINSKRISVSPYSDVHKLPCLLITSTGALLFATELLKGDNSHNSPVAVYRWPNPTDFEIYTNTVVGDSTTAKLGYQYLFEVNGEIILEARKHPDIPHYRVFYKSTDDGVSFGTVQQYINYDNDKDFWMYSGQVGNQKKGENILLSVTPYDYDINTGFRPGYKYITYLRTDFTNGFFSLNGTDLGTDLNKTELETNRSWGEIIKDNKRYYARHSKVFGDYIYTVGQLGEWNDTTKTLKMTHMQIARIHKTTGVVEKGGAFPTVITKTDNHEYLTLFSINGKIGLKIGDANNMYYYWLFNDLNGIELIGQDNGNYHWAILTDMHSELSADYDTVTKKLRIFRFSDPDTAILGDKTADSLSATFNFSMAMEGAIVNNTPNQSPLKVDLLSVWELDENSGSVAIDSHGGFDGTNTDALINQTGKTNKCYDFNGTTSKVVTPAVTEATIRTMAFWIYPQTYGGAGYGRMLVKTGGSYATSSDILQALLDGGTKCFRYHHRFSTGGGNWVTPANSVPLNQWTHVIVEFDDSSPTNDPIININGVQVSVSEIATPAGNTVRNENSPYVLGNMHYNTTRSFDGLIDQVAIWNRALTPEEKTQIYNSGNGLPFTQW